MKNILFTIIFLVLLSSCEKAILGNEPENAPEAIFETLWHDFDKHYSLFIVRGTDWNGLYNRYRPQVTASTTEDELWEVCSNLIEHLDDGHTFIERYGPQETYVSGNTINARSIKEFSESLITSKYLENRTELATERISYGKVKDKDIGYIHILEEEGQDPSKIDQVIDALKAHKALIVDIRQNVGGQDYYTERIAGVFADSEQFVFTVATRNGADHNAFDPPKAYYSRKKGDEQFTKPIIVLTDRATISAGELFLIYMKSFNHVTQMGDTTAGDFSAISNRRFLPNGWTYQYSIQKLLLPDGSSLDGVGHVPDVYIKNTEADIVAGNDLVIEEAIAYLWTTYGIE